MTAPAASPLDAAFAAWRRLPLGVHVLAVVCLVALAGVRWRLPLIEPLLVDERYYLSGFEALADGDSPYAAPGFFYPPAFAYAGAWLLQHAGQWPLVYALRVLNLVTLALVVWYAFAWAPLAWTRRLLLALAFIWLAPLVHLGLFSGNLSFPVVAAILLGLALWPRTPSLSGLLLGASVVVKPIAPAAIVALLAHRPAAGGRRHLLAGTVAVAVAGVLLLAFPHLGDFLALGHAESRDTRAISLLRAGRALGLPLGGLEVAAAVALVTAVLVRRRSLDGVQFHAVAVAAAILATPVVWNHTLLLTLPLQVMAVTLAADRLAAARRRALPPSALRFRLYELLLVLGGAGLVQFCDGVDGLTPFASWIRATGILLPVLAPAALAAYVVARRDGGAADDRALSGS